MKHLELRKEFKNKYLIRVAAGAVTIAVLGTSVGMNTYLVQAERNAQETAATIENSDENTTGISNAENKNNENTDKTGNAERTDRTDNSKTEKEAGNAQADMGTSSEKRKEDAEKEETVYIVAAPNGSAKNVIVSEWLKNEGKSSSITDASDLREIQNVKGDETFTQSGEELTWQAEGKDIYYQGTTDRELPVTERVSYYLDGKKMAPEEMAGKSGQVKIRFDYENHERTTQVIDGEKHEVYVPFTVLTGMVLPEDFTNVKVTNGRVISDGNKKMVVGFAMPGLKDSLKLDEKKPDADKDSPEDEKGLDADVEIPDYVEVSADVENFSLEMTMSVVVNDLLNEGSLEDAFDLTDLEDDLDTLSDASTELVKGSTDLSEGLGTLKGSMKEFSDGVNTLKDGIHSYTDGASRLNSGIQTLAGSSGALMDGVSTLNSSAATLNQGVAELEGGNDGARKGGFGKTGRQCD